MTKFYIELKITVFDVLTAVGILDLFFDVLTPAGILDLLLYIHFCSV